MSYKVIKNEVKHIGRELNDICEVDNNRYIIPCLVDFDGTVVRHLYPRVGAPVPHAIELMKEYTNLYNVGWILDTMRSGELLEEAVKYIESKGLKLYGVGINPTQHEWTDSTKAYGVYRWDDNCAGVPKICEDGERPYLDWVAIDKEMRPILEQLADIKA